MTIGRQYELMQERDAARDRYLHAQAVIKELYKSLESQQRYIQELEKQLGHYDPELLREVREYVEGTNAD